MRSSSDPCFVRCCAAIASAAGRSATSNERILWTHDALGAPLSALPAARRGTARAVAASARQAHRRAPRRAMVVAVSHRRRALRHAARRLERHRARAARRDSRCGRPDGSAQQLLRRSLSPSDRDARGARGAAQRSAGARVVERRRRTRARRLPPLPRLDDVVAARTKGLASRSRCARAARRPRPRRRRRRARAICSTRRSTRFVSFGRTSSRSSNGCRHERLRSSCRSTMRSRPSLERWSTNASPFPLDSAASHCARINAPRRRDWRRSSRPTAARCSPSQSDSARHTRRWRSRRDSVRVCSSRRRRRSRACGVTRSPNASSTPSWSRTRR